MDVGVFVLVEVGQAIYDHLRLLRRGRIVEPDELAPVDPFAQDREVPPYSLYLEAGVVGQSHSGGPGGTSGAVVDKVERRRPG
jgi:hypothetical protein